VMEVYRILWGAITFPFGTSTTLLDLQNRSMNRE
jgi:hypothetical protein